MAKCLYDCLREAHLDHYYHSFLALGITRTDGLGVLTMQDYSRLGIKSMDDRVRLFKLIQIVKTVRHKGRSCKHRQATLGESVIENHKIHAEPNGNQQQKPALRYKTRSRRGRTLSGPKDFSEQNWGSIVKPDRSSHPLVYYKDSDSPHFRCRRTLDFSDCEENTSMEGTDTRNELGVNSQVAVTTIPDTEGSKASQETESLGFSESDRATRSKDAAHGQSQAKEPATDCDLQKPIVDTLAQLRDMKSTTVSTLACKEPQSSSGHQIHQMAVEVEERNIAGQGIPDTGHVTDKEVLVTSGSCSTGQSQPTTEKGDKSLNTSQGLSVVTETKVHIKSTFENSLSIVKGITYGGKSIYGNSVASDTSLAITHDPKVAGPTKISSLRADKHMELSGDKQVYNIDIEKTTSDKISKHSQMNPTPRKVDLIKNPSLSDMVTSEPTAAKENDFHSDQQQEHFATTEAYHHTDQKRSQVVVNPRAMVPEGALVAEGNKQIIEPTPASGITHMSPITSQQRSYDQNICETNVTQKPNMPQSPSDDGASRESRPSASVITDSRPKPFFKDIDPQPVISPDRLNSSNYVHKSPKNDQQKPGEFHFKKPSAMFVEPRENHAYFPAGQGLPKLHPQHSVEKVYHNTGYNYGVPSSPQKPNKPKEAGATNTVTSIMKVCARKRPLNRRERNRAERDIVRVEGLNTLILDEPKVALDLTPYTQQHVFSFDEVFGEQHTNRDVYEKTVKSLVDHACHGGTSTCFAFGQTGAGKTHTLLGSKQSQGLYSLAATDLFATMQHRNKPLPLHLWVTYYEIYRGQLYDLLNKRHKLYVRENSEQRVCIAGLTETEVKDVKALTQVVDYGNRARSTGSTGINPHSSRSHAVLRLEVRDSREHPHGRLSFVDLAGSERASDVSNFDRQTRMEGAEINQSLLALKECIRSLDQDSKHTPYRQSKLTHILRDSFVGNTSTCMIANVAPSDRASENTLNTLLYASRVKGLHCNSSAPTAAQQTTKPQRSPPSATPPSLGDTIKSSPETTTGTFIPSGPAFFHPSNIQCSSTPKATPSKSSPGSPFSSKPVALYETPIKGHKLNKSSARRKVRLAQMSTEPNQKSSGTKVKDLPKFCPKRESGSSHGNGEGGNDTFTLHGASECTPENEPFLVKNGQTEAESDSRQQGQSAVVQHDITHSSTQDSTSNIEDHKIDSARVPKPESLNKENGAPESNHEMGTILARHNDILSQVDEILDKARLTIENSYPKDPYQNNGQMRQVNGDGGCQPQHTDPHKGDLGWSGVVMQDIDGVREHISTRTVPPPIDLHSHQDRPENICTSADDRRPKLRTSPGSPRGNTAFKLDSFKAAILPSKPTLGLFSPQKSEQSKKALPSPEEFLKSLAQMKTGKEHAGATTEDGPTDDGPGSESTTDQLLQSGALRPFPDLLGSPSNFRRTSPFQPYPRPTGKQLTKPHSRTESGNKIDNATMDSVLPLSGQIENQGFAAGEQPATVPSGAQHGLLQKPTNCSAVVDTGGSTNRRQGEVDEANRSKTWDEVLSKDQDKEQIKAGDLSTGDQVRSVSQGSSRQQDTDADSGLGTNTAAQDIPRSKTTDGRHSGNEDYRIEADPPSTTETLDDVASLAEQIPMTGDTRSQPQYHGSDCRLVAGHGNHDGKDMHEKVDQTESGSHVMDGADTDSRDSLQDTLELLSSAQGMLSEISQASPFRDIESVRRAAQDKNSDTQDHPDRPVNPHHQTLEDAQLPSKSPIRTEKLGVFNVGSMFSPIHPFPVTPFGGDGISAPSAVTKTILTDTECNNNDIKIARNNENILASSQNEAGSEVKVQLPGTPEGSSGSSSRRSSQGSRESALRRAQNLLISAHEEQLADITALCKHEMKLLMSAKAGHTGFDDYLLLLMDLLTSKAHCVATLMSQVKEVAVYPSSLPTQQSDTSPPSALCR